MSDPTNPAASEVQPVVQGEPEVKTVSYETHRRLLDEKKKATEKLAALEAEKSERERKEAEAAGNFQQLLEKERKEKEELAAKVSSFEQQRVQASKLSSVLKALEGSVDEKFWGMLPLDLVVVDPVTGEVDGASVAKVAGMVKTNYPEILKPKNPPALPNGAPQGNGAGKITRSEWLKLSAAEMQKWKPNQIIQE